MMTKQFAGDMGIGLVLGGMLGGADILRIVLAREMFFSGAEMLLAGVWTLGICLGGGLLSALLLAEGARLGERILVAVGWWKTRWKRALAVGLGLLPPLLFMLFSLTSGPQASRVAGRAAMVIAAGVISAVMGGSLIAWAPAVVQRYGRRARIVAALFTVAAVAALHTADALILVRLYPAFHTALTVAALLGGWFGLSLFMPRPERAKVVVTMLLIGAGALGYSGVSLWKVLGKQNTRFVITEKAPTAADFISLALLAAPPPPDKILDDDISAPETTALAESVPTLTLPGSDVFLITVDAMRYDRLRALGGTRTVAPNIDELAADSVVFSRAYTSVPHTSYAITSLLSGKYTKPLFEVPGAPAVQETWPEILHRFRYETSAFFSPAIFFIDRARFEPYLRKGAGFQFRHADSRFSALERIELLIEHLEKKRGNDRPHFAWMHFFDPHEPYVPICPELGNRPEDRYDCEIHLVDEALATLFRYLKDKRPDAIIIVTSDHGEEFGDHGGKYHGSSLYDEQVRVPLLVHAPTLAPRIVDTPVSLVDLLGTTLRILDIPVPARVRSRDLTPLLTGETLSLDAFAEAHGDAMVVYNGYKLICSEQRDLCRLYNLEKDPAERRSIADEKPRIVDDMKRRIAWWNASHAREELRPVLTDTGARRSWPAPIQRALGGDDDAVPLLAQLIGDSREPRIRRKAAELIFNMAERPVSDVGALETEGDVSVAVWLLAHQVKTGVGDALDLLAERAAELSPESRERRAAALVRMAADDPSDTETVLGIALDENAPMEQRRTAVRLLAGAENRRLGREIIPLINVYQLTLETAATLAALKTTTAVEPLIKRLKRERFLERKAIIMGALAGIGDRRALSEMTAEMFNETPPPGGLGAILRLSRPSKGGRRLVVQGKGRRAILFGPVSEKSIPVSMAEASRVIVRTKAPAAGGSVAIICGDATVASIPIFAGESEGSTDLEGCSQGDRRSLYVRFELREALGDTTLEAALILSGELP